MESKLPRWYPDKKTISITGNGLDRALEAILSVHVFNTYKAASNRTKKALKPAAGSC